MKESLDTHAQHWWRYITQLQEAKKDYLGHIEQQMDILRAGGGERWQYYNSDIENDFSGYFNPESSESFYGLGDFSAKKFIEEIERFRAQPENKNSRVIIFDAFGQGSPFIGLADDIIATTLHKNYRPQPGVTEFNGDALSEKVSQQVFSHIRNLKESGAVLRATFFRPVAGLMWVDHNLYVYHTLYERLREIYDMTDEGGLIFVQSIGPGHDIDFLEQILSDRSMRRILTADAMPSHKRILIRKNSAMCKTLPDIKEVAHKHPEIIEALLNVHRQVRPL